MTSPIAVPSELLADRDGERLDVFLARRQQDASRAEARRQIDEGLVRVDGSLERPGHRLRAGEMVVVSPRQEAAPQAVEIQLRLLREDDDLIILDKPAGLTVHPAPGERQTTLASALLQRWPELSRLGDALRPGLVHRLDRDTTGALVIARSQRALDSLQRQFRERSVEKRYLAVVAGSPDPPAGIIDAPLARDPADPRRFAVVEPGRGRASRTGYQLLEQFGDAALLECDLITGRTHQIRVHLAAVGHGIIGDALYGLARDAIPRQALHARSIAFDHPATGERIRCEAPLPADLEHLLARLRGGELLFGDLGLGPDPAAGRRERRSGGRTRQRRAHRVR